MARRASTSVLVPWAGGCEHRERAYRWVRERLTLTHPHWEVVEGSGGEPWCKAAAVEDGLTRASGDVLVVHDADVWVPNLAAAVAVLEAGAPWVMPHRLVHRLNREATGMVYAGANPHDLRLPYDEDPYIGWPGGGVVVLNRADYQRAPLDRRFVGWSGEDASWAYALDTLVGPGERLDADLVHLWHPPQPRMNRRFGSHQSQALWHRYRRARDRPDRMAALVAEGRLA
jgi:hypothetical protein